MYNLKKSTSPLWITSIARFLAIGLLTVSSSSYAVQAGQQVGSITFVKGDALAERVGGMRTSLNKGYPVNNGDSIETKANGMLQLRMVDGTQISLQPNTIFRVDDYAYNGSEDGSEKSFTSLLKGALRTISGAIGHKNKRNYAMNTPTATIGIRGTEFALSYNGESLVTVGEGAVNMCNGNKCLDLVAGQSAIVASPTSAPVLTGKVVAKAKKAADAPAVALDTQDTTKVELLIGEGSETSTLPVVVNTEAGTVSAIAIEANREPSLGLEFATFGLDANSKVVKISVDVDNRVSTAQAITIAENNSDGIVKWGRWTSTNLSGVTGTPPVNTNVNVLHYAANLSAQATPDSALQNLGSIGNPAAVYNVIASTAPTLSDAGGSIISTGISNTVNGQLTAAFSAGTIGYNFVVPVTSSSSVNFVGTAQFDGGASFVDVAPSSTGGLPLTNTATGGICGIGCTGVTTGGEFVQGSIAGLNAERAYLTYGAKNISNQTLTGAVIFSKLAIPSTGSTGSGP